MKKHICTIIAIAVLAPLIVYAALGVAQRPPTSLGVTSRDVVEVSIIQIDNNQFAVAVSKFGVGICQVK